MIMGNFLVRHLGLWCWIWSVWRSGNRRIGNLNVCMHFGDTQTLQEGGKLRQTDDHGHDMKVLSTRNSSCDVNGSRDGDDGEGRLRGEACTVPGVYDSCDSSQGTRPSRWPDQRRPATSA